MLNYNLRMFFVLIYFPIDTNSIFHYWLSELYKLKGHLLTDLSPQIHIKRINSRKSIIRSSILLTKLFF